MEVGKETNEEMGRQLPGVSGLPFSRSRKNDRDSREMVTTGGVITIVVPQPFSMN